MGTVEAQCEVFSRATHQKKTPQHILSYYRTVRPALVFCLVFILRVGVARDPFWKDYPDINSFTDNSGEGHLDSPHALQLACGKVQ